MSGAENDGENHEIVKAAAVEFMADCYCFETFSVLCALHRVIELVGFVLLMIHSQRMGKRSFVLV